jgi:hypothetical protein
MPPEDTQNAEPDLMALAMQADAATSDTAPSPEPKETVKADEQASSEQTGTQPEAQQEEPAQEQTPAPEKEAAPTESKFKKAQKEQARLADGWKKLDNEKAQLRAEREAIAREREAHRRQQETQSLSKKSESNGPTPEDYETLAAKYEARGDDNMAMAARQKARALRDTQAQQAPARTAQPDWQSPEFQAKWQETVDELIRQDPSLSDSTNPVVGTTNRLINDSNYGRFFRAHPDGIRAAHEVARIIESASTAQTQLKGLQQELTKLKAENQRLTKLTAISGSAPAAGNPVLNKKAGVVSDDELMRMAREADAQGG